MMVIMMIMVTMMIMVIMMVMVMMTMMMVKVVMVTNHKKPVQVRPDQDYLIEGEKEG